MTAALIIVPLLVVLALWAVWWVRFLVSVYQLISERLALASRESSRPSSLPGEGDPDHPEHHRPHPEPSSRVSLLSSPPPAGCTADLESAGFVQLLAADRDYRDDWPHPLWSFSSLPIGAALDPDFDAFFGGMEAAILSGGVVVIALVVVLTVRRFVSF